MPNFQEAFKVVNVNCIKICNNIFDNKPDSPERLAARKELGLELHAEHPHVSSYTIEKRDGDFYIVVAKSSTPSAPAKRDNPFR